MNRIELTDLLVTSCQQYSQAKFIPWWEDDYENSGYWYEIFEQKTIEEVKICIAACEKEELLAPVSRIGLTLFHLLVWHNFYDVVKELLCSGTITEEEVNLPDLNGNGLTPLLLTCLCGNLSMAELLLEHGADDSVCDKRGMNAFHFLAYARFEGVELAFACREHSADQRAGIARLLNCDINQKAENKMTPLARLVSTECSSDYSYQLPEIFLEKGAAVDYVDENGNTLLLLALMNNHRTAAMKLMEQCPQMLDQANRQGVTPVSHTVSWQDQAMYLALTDHGAAPADREEIQLFPLSQITGNVFCDVSGDNRDALSIALYLTKKLVEQADLDDDDELGEVTDILHNALIADPDAAVLDTFHEAGVDFTMQIHYRGERICMRDEIISRCCGTKVLQKLAKLHVDLDEAVVYGRTPVNLIASRERRRDAKDESFFEEAAGFFSVESMEQLNNQGQAAIHLAAKEGHTGMLKAMMEKGADVNLTEDAPAQAGTTALHEACANGHADAVRLLIQANADDTMKNLEGETPAHFAVMNRKYRQPLQAGQKVAILKELKNIDIPGNDGKTPFMLNTDSELLPVFLERGVDVNHKDNNGMTAIMLHPDKDLIKPLLRAGADLHLADNEGNTVLHHALYEYAEGTARYLIKKGADYNRPNNAGETPVQIAAEKGFDTVLELMTEID